mmetsp:Transcript_30001/g.47019  ORF Transcript_30001/g.47019 Transcript_30001/m.47019 type:complete len:141 (+) Transcript_30001:89-511(+)
MTPCTPLQAALHRKRLAEKKKKKKATSSNATGADSLEEVLTKRLREYLNQDFDPEHELRMQYKRMGESTNDIDWKRVKGVSPDILYISSKFDMLEWWKTQGKTEYWERCLLLMLFSSACSALPLGLTILSGKAWDTIVLR